MIMRRMSLSHWRTWMPTSYGPYSSTIFWNIFGYFISVYVEWLFGCFIIYQVSYTMYNLYHCLYYLAALYCLLSHTLVHYHIWCLILRCIPWVRAVRKCMQEKMYAREGTSMSSPRTVFPLWTSKWCTRYV